MQLHAALVPPPALVAAVRRQIEAVPRSPSPVETADPPVAPRRRLFGRRATPEPAMVLAPMLDLVDPERLFLPLTAFGSVTTGDANRLVRTLQQACSELVGPVLEPGGGQALEPEGDDHVWLRLRAPDDHDEALRRIAPTVVRAVEKVGFFCDRRAFRPALALGTVNARTTAPYLEAVVAALDGFAHEPWPVEAVSVMQRVPDDPRRGSVEMERIPIDPLPTP